MRFLKSLRPPFLFCLALFFLFTAAAQDTTDSAFAIDTTLFFDTAAVTEKEPEFLFDSLTATPLLITEQRSLPDSAVQRLRNDDAFWYANADFKKKEPPSGAPRTAPLFNLFGQPWFRTLLWVIIVGSFITVLLLFLWKSDVFLFRKTPVTIDQAITDEAAENIFTISYETEIGKAVQRSDYRLAIRLHYLQLLAVLSGKNHIQYSQDATNSDYLSQLYQTPYYTPFKKLTRHFDYAWYGQFDVTPAAYQNIDADFKTFKNNMGN